MKRRPLKTNTEPELVLHEMLMHDVYDLPSETEEPRRTSPRSAEHDLGPQAAHLHLRRRTGLHGGARL